MVVLHHYRCVCVCCSMCVCVRARVCGVLLQSAQLFKWGPGGPVLTVRVEAAHPVVTSMGT